MISKKVYQKLLTFESIVPNNCVITGGHFMLRGDQKPNLNTGTQLSFEIAAKLFSNTSRAQQGIGLGLLLNNIGSTCDTSVCYVNSSDTTFTFPNEYKTILEENNVHFDDLQLFWEKFLRNRGRTELDHRTKKMNTLTKDEDGWWLKDNTGKNYMLTRRTGTPTCPLIMATYALDLERKGYQTSLNFYYVDSDNFENIPNYLMCEKGYEVAKLFGATIKMMNVYFTKDKVITNF